MATRQSSSASPQPPTPSEFRLLWIPFTESARPFLVPAIDDRTLDQFLIFRDKVYVLIQNERFIQGLESALQFAPEDFEGFPRELVPQTQEAIFEELRAYIRAAEVIRSTEAALSTSEEGRKKIKAQLSKLSTTLGSLKDVLTEFPYLKLGVGLYKELVDFFK